MMRDKSKTNYERCYSRRSNELPRAEPVPHPLEMSRFLPNSSQDIPGEKWRKRGLRKPAENVP